MHMHDIYVYAQHICVYLCNCTELATSCRFCILWTKPKPDGKCLENSVSVLNM